MNTANPTILIGVMSAIWYILLIIGNLKMFKKAGKPAILAIIPVINFFVLVDAVTGGKWYKGFWIIVPIADIIFLIKLSIKTAKCYGFGAGMGILNLFFSGLTHIIMGFSSNPFIVEE